MIKKENVTHLCAGMRFLVEDKESGSRALMPILIDDGYEVEVVKVDNGKLHNGKKNERACDFMLIAKGENDKDKIVCMAELKGTANGKEVAHAYSQIRQSINRIPAEYIGGSNYLMAAVAGARDKTLPSMINPEKRELCKIMFSKSKRKVRDMSRLVFFVQPSKKTRKAYVNVSRNPCVIECGLEKSADIPVPSMLKDVVEK